MKIFKTFALFAAAVIVMALTSCSNENLEGTWKADINGTDFYVTFNEDGTGTMKTENVKVATFKYEKESDNVLKVDVKTGGIEEKDLKWEYKFEDGGKKLTLDDGENTEFWKYATGGSTTFTREEK